MSDGVHVSLIELSLSDYIRARRAYCTHRHRSPCIKCESMLQVAVLVLSEGYCSLPHAFYIVSPDVKYTAERARRKLLQKPLVSVCIGNPAKGKAFTILLEHCHGVNYSKMSLVLNGMVSSFTTQNQLVLEKDCVKMLLGLAESDRERECIKYAIFKASGMTATRARHQYGFEHMAERSARVEKAIVEVQQIRETVEDIARIQDKALLASFGVSHESSDSSGESEPDDEHVSPSLCELSPNLLELCRRTLTQSNHNWFELQEVLEGEPECNSDRVLERLFYDLPTLGFTKHQLELITQSKEAYAAAQKDACELERTARVLNGCIVTEPESDDPELIARLHDPLSESGRLLISKQRKAIQRRTRRLRAKAVAEQVSFQEIIYTNQ